MSTRDDFTRATKERLAKSVAYLCSHPECRRTTIGPAKGSDKPVVTGEAAHITAAASGGPRYNPALTQEERKNPSNGIWLCAIHAKQVDSDEKYFTVELLRKWKKEAENNAFLALTSGRYSIPVLIPEIDTAVLEALGLKDVDIEILSKRLLEAAKLDISGFKSTARWPDHAISLTLRTTDLDGPPIDVLGCVAGIQASRELAIVAPPGTGKTTTSIQIVDAILTKGEKIAILIPLNEWATEGGELFESLTHRTNFRNVRKQDFFLLAMHGRLTLILDGWNELDPNSRKRVITAVSKLRRDLPLLEIIITSRPQQLGSLLTGPTLEIEGMSENQQLEIARSAYGSTGEQILDRAWRTPGLRELVSIPLYLNALLKKRPACTLPRSKEEILRLFVNQHEESLEKAEILRQGLYGFHNDYLIGLAVEATLLGNTAIPENRSRTTVTVISERLKKEGQISQAPQPSDVLDLLVNHHVLIKSGSGSISFQHEQIQEFYASYEVETLIKKSTTGNKNAKERLLKEIINIPIWEEAILFACERLSYAGDSEINAFSECIIDTLGIDPILAADMIYRSTEAVWEKIKDKVVEFVTKWHMEGVVDRAVRFMITSGRKEFASFVWPLITHGDDQISFKALRAAKRFRPSVLGPDVVTRLLELPEHIRQCVATEIAYNSGIEGQELMADLAKNDASPKICSEIIEILFFRRANRIAKEVLETATDKVWIELAKKSHIDQIVDVESAKRLRLKRECLIKNEPNMLTRINMCLWSKEKFPSDDKNISEIIQSPDLPTKDAVWTVHHAFKKYPDAVSSALIHRIENGYDLPMGSKEMLAYCNPIDEGPIVEIILSGKDKRATMNAVTLVGAQTIKHLMDELISTNKRMISKNSGYSKEESDDYHFRLDLVTHSRLLPFINAWLSYADTDDPAMIALLSETFYRYRSDYDEEVFLQLDESIREQVESILLKWSDILLSSSTSTRHQLSKLAVAIGLLRSTKLISVLSRLLAEELAGFHRSREEY
ncbi:MAG: NACHT domain-containing protein, partial [Smithella sp.]